MNYLTHFLVDHQRDRPHYNFGLAMPDLVNVAKRGWKPVSTVGFEDGNARMNGNKNAAEIWNGYQQHIRADAFFHNTDLFNHHTKRLRKELEKFGLMQEGTRLFFVAHVLLEIMIDRHIVKTRRHIPDLFYQHLNEISEADIQNFFRISGTSVPDRFLEFFGKFKESKYLYGYEDDNGIFYSINRLLHRTKQPTFETDAQNRAFLELINQEEKYLEEEIEVFLKR
jgi:hypothetical protein